MKMALYNIIHDVPVEFRIYDGTIGINLSGGVDSALILYLLMRYSSSKIHAFTIASEQKFRVNSNVAVNVINKCIDLTNNLNIEHHTIYHPVQNEKLLHTLPKLFLKNRSIDMVYTGVTANPPIDICNTFNEERVVIRDYEFDKAVLFDNESYYNPWANCHKKDIASMYNHFDLLNTLFPLTRSCEYLKADSSTTVAHNYHCGKCWWCQERMWGFGRL